MQFRMTRMASRFERLEITVRNDVDWTAPAKDVLIPESQRRTLMQLTEQTCRWPVGDPADPSFFFCGGPTENGGAYCPLHRARASHVVPLVPIRMPANCRLA